MKREIPNRRPCINTRTAGYFKVVAVLIFQSSHIQLLRPSAVMADGIELILFKHASKRRSTHNQRTLNDLEFNRKHRG